MWSGFELSAKRRHNAARYLYKVTRYVCGEVPYEKNDALIRSYGAWRQSEYDDGMDENGVILRLHPRTSPALLNRLRRSAKQFASKVNCNMEYFLSREEHRRAYVEENSSYLTASMMDKAVDDAEQHNFPDLRVYFSKEEVEELLNRYVSRQDLKYENGRTFEKPDVYYCMRDVHPSFNSVKSKFKDMDGYGFEDLRNLLNALFPGTVMSLFTSDGDNITDTCENYNEIHRPNDMTVYGFYSYVEESQTVEPNKLWKARFVLEAPKWHLCRP